MLQPNQCSRCRPGAPPAERRADRCWYCRRHSQGARRRRARAAHERPGRSSCLRRWGHASVQRASRHRMRGAVACRSGAHAAARRPGRADEPGSVRARGARARSATQGHTHRCAAGSRACTISLLHASSLPARMARSRAGAAGTPFSWPTAHQLLFDWQALWPTKNRPTQT